MIIAGEASGDLHGAGVIRELKKLSPNADCFGVGGDKMQSAGMQLIYHVRELSVMGFWEVLQHLPLLRSVERTLVALLKARRPDVVLLIDYPGFNLKFAGIAHRLGFRTVYYISPQVWAWNPGRVKKMKGIIDKMLVVFPFESEIYRRHGIDVEFVGHPLLEVLDEPQGKEEFCKRHGLLPDQLILGLFPGSRRQELERIFPAMLGAARLLHQQLGVQVAVGVSSLLEFEFVKSFLRDDFPVRLLQHAAHDLMKNADVALVTSGTATLETAFFRTPMVIVYKTSMLTYLVGRLVVRIDSIGLANIVAGKKVVPELIQGAATPQRLAEEAMKMLSDAELRKTISRELGAVRERLGTVGASQRVAQSLLPLS